eukprot:3639759-Prymnesium_polylepis.2
MRSRTQHTSSLGRYEKTQCALTRRRKTLQTHERRGRANVREKGTALYPEVRGAEPVTRSLSLLSHG